MPDARPALRLLHYWWPVIMGGSTVLVVQRATSRDINGTGLALLLSGILAAYSLDRILDAPGLMQPRWLRWALRIGSSIGVVAGAILIARIPLRTALLVPAIGVLVLAYPRLKSLPMLKTVLVPAVWTCALIALPFDDGSWFGWHAWTTPVAIPLILIFASGCLLCDLKDVQRDRAAAVASLPAVVGENRAIAIALVLAAIGASFALVEHRTGLVIGALGMGVLAMYPNLIARDVVGPLLVDMMLTVPGLLIAFRLV